MTEPNVGIQDLPMSFEVRYLGCQPCKGLWGIKHTKKPVSSLVQAAQKLPANKVLPFVKLDVQLDGMHFVELPSGGPTRLTETFFKVDAISYGVQDIVYTRVFCVIVVRDVDIKEGVPFVCHAFACPSKHQARKLTFALAAAFQNYANTMKDAQGNLQKKRFAIDLRGPSEMGEALSDEETEA